MFSTTLGYLPVTILLQARKFTRVNGFPMVELLPQALGLMETRFFA
jgi:hypothetical protein